MKAAVHARFGPPEVVRVAEVDMPTITADEVLVKVYATTVNRTDCAYRAGKPFVARFAYGWRSPRVRILGCEFAGVVEAVGGDVTSFRVGDRVFGYNEGRFGAHAEYLPVRAGGAIAVMPANRAYAAVAPGTEGAHYALGLIRKAKIRRGHDVLVNGATGAIGSAAVQLLKNVGATVTGVCDTGHLDLVKGLGADRVIDYTAQDFTTDENSYDVVIDAVGKSSFGRCRRLLRPGGIYMSTELGPRGQNPFLALVTPLLRGKKVLFPIPTQNQEMVRHLKELIASGEFEPVVDRSYPLDQIVEAYGYVETGQKIGNVVITVEAADAA